jgi:hypothetical protein
MKRFQDKESQAENRRRKNQAGKGKDRAQGMSEAADPANAIELLLEAQNTCGNEFVNDVAANAGNLDMNRMRLVLNEALSFRGQGVPLPETLQRQAEKSLGRTLDGINVHTGREAAGLASAADSRAFTVGNDIFLPAQSFPPSNSNDLGLLSHEIVHSAQQSGGNQAIAEDASLEMQAEQIGNAIEHGGSGQFAVPLGPVPALQRVPGAATGIVTIPEPTVDYEEYSGATLADVAALLPEDEWGRCEWDFTHSFESTEGTITRVDVTLTRRIVMPRWVERDQAPAAERAEWDRMVRNLRTHENGHATRARTWAPRLKQRMLNQPESEEANIKETFLTDHQAEQDQYDTDTHHGQTQGVTLNTGSSE